MRGWATDITPAYGEPERFSRPVVGLIAHSKTDPARVAAKVEAAPDTSMFVLRGKPTKGDPVLPLLPTIDYVVAEKNKQWGKWAEDWRNTEILQGCTRVFVFHTPGTYTDWFAQRANLWPNLIILQQPELPSTNG